MTPDFQLFQNAKEEIKRSCIYRPDDHSVIVGALQTLAKSLGQPYVRYFPALVPEKPGDALRTYAETIEEVAGDPAAHAAGWTIKKLVERSLETYCQSLDDYSTYMDEDRTRRQAEASQADYVGIGLTLKKTDRGFFCYPFRGDAADRAGVLKGDELLAIENAVARSSTLLDLTEMLGGKPGTAVKLKVRHQDGVSETLVAKREAIVSSPLAIDQTADISHITITRINVRAFEDLRLALISFGPNRKIKLDLRGCGGGPLADAVRMAELFLPEKTVIARVKYVRGDEMHVSANRAPYRPSRLILLQDNGTGSGAELLIAALLAYAPLKAESRGENTYGKGVTNGLIQVARGGILKITDGLIFGPRDEYWEKDGLSPTSDAAPDAP